MTNDNLHQDDSLMLPIGPLCITELYANLEKVSNPELAAVISKAFERSAIDQKELVLQIKKETLAEINIQDLATKKDLNALRLEIKEDMNDLRNDLRQEFKTELKHYATKADLHTTVNTAKWQVLGGVALMLFTQIALKHFGV